MEYRRSPSIERRNRLVQMNVGLVRKVAHRVSRQCSEPYEDLEQIGLIGLIRAIERFDPGHGYAFSSFAVPYIRGEILHFLRDHGNTIKIPRRWQEIHKEAQRARGTLLAQLGHEPSDTAMAEALSISVEEWQEVKLSHRNRSPLSLDIRLNQSLEDGCTIGESLADHHIQRLQRHEENRQHLQQAMVFVEEKARSAIEGVFFEGLSRRELAVRCGVSPMTITRRIQRGLRQLLPHLDTDKVHWQQADS